jgi:putative phosphoribosyl transferase
MSYIFNDRAEAGRALARELSGYGGREDAIVLALPRGGLPVAYEVATALGLPLDVLTVRKLGLPFQPELAIGAIASGDVTILDERVVEELGIPRQEVIKIRNHELIELDRRERLYRRGRGALNLRGKLAIIVDDGVATGSTMKAAIEAVRRLAADRVVVAVPVAPARTRDAMQHIADDVICLSCPERFQAVGQWYAQFGQVSDKEVQRLLADARKLVTVGAAAPALDVERRENCAQLETALDCDTPEAGGLAERLHIHERHIHIDRPGFTLDGDLAIPAETRGIILFAHGSGSSRHSPRNKFGAR